MSQLLSRFAKQQQLCFLGSHFFSTVAAKPYLLFNETIKKATVAVDINLYDPCKDERVKIPDQSVSEELHFSLRMGSSRGWVCMKNLYDNKVRLTNIFNPCASVASHKVISLPPLDDSKSHVSNIALSASPNDPHQDCVVAAKSCSHFISLCRPGDSEWTRIRVPFFASTVMYSVRDRRFYLHRRGESDEGPFDLIESSSSDFPQVSLFKSLPNSDIPKSRQDQFVSSFKTEYLVESPSGDSFIVYWCDDHFRKAQVKPSHREKSSAAYIANLRRKPRAFVVFRQDSEQMTGSYTQDIGDLCIFLSKSEAFCVSATEYPGLKPNSVYFASLFTGFGLYDLSSNTLHDLVHPPPFSTSYHWLAPLH